MKKIIILNEFLNEFVKNYDYLYENRDNVPGYDDKVRAFDEMLQDPAQCENLKRFILYRGDLVASDRECAAYVITIESMAGFNCDFIFKTFVDDVKVCSWIIENFNDDDQPDTSGIYNIIKRIQEVQTIETGRRNVTHWEAFKYWCYGLPALLNTSDYLLGERAPDVLRDWTGSAKNYSQSEAELYITVILYYEIWGVKYDKF